MGRKLLSILLSAFLSISLFAQTAQLKGRIINLQELPLEGATIEIAGESLSTSSGQDGSFILEGIPYGIKSVRVLLDKSVLLEMPVTLDQPLVNLGDLKQSAERSQNQVENIPTMTLSDSDMKDGSAQNVSGVLSASRDPFISATSFTFMAVRFRLRGYDASHFTTLMNGAPMNDLVTGRTIWSLWGGLNDVMRNRENSLGLMPNTDLYGGVGGTFSLDSRASRQRKELRVSYAATNRQYRNRLMATYSTGLMKGGWAVSASVSRRWAQEGYVPGTFYDGYSYFLAVEKLFGLNHSLNLTVFGAPTRLGRSTPSVQQFYLLAGTNFYNPSWGWQNGKKRNANVNEFHTPVIIMSHEWKIKDNITLETTGSFLFGTNNSSAIDWNNAPDPRPDFYRYLPTFIEDSALRVEAFNLYANNKDLMQINWDRMYQANRSSLETIQDADGIPGNQVTGRRARYIVEDRVIDNKRATFYTNYNHSLGDHLDIAAGLMYVYQNSRYYKKVKDLLGADFYVDINQFAIRDFPDNPNTQQNDLNRPNRILKEGDVFGYDYRAIIHRPSTWLQLTYKTNHIDVFAAGELTYTAYWRDGNMRNGFFPENSFGKSEILKFFNYSLKGGVTGKIDGRNYVFAHGLYQTRAPLFENAFLSPRTRNQVAGGLSNEVNYSAEAGYNLRTPKVKLKLAGYYTEFRNQTNTVNFFHDDFRTFVNYTLTGMNTRHYGGEAAIDASIWKGIGITAVAAIGRYQYTSRPEATITRDNTSATVADRQTVYINNFNVAGSPQLASSIGLSYRSPYFWFVNLSFNYYDWMWTDFNPARRTQPALDLVDPNSSLWQQTVSQERLKHLYTLDFFGGYSFKIDKYAKGLKRPMYLQLNAGVNNMLNNTNMRYGGFEQLRFDFFESNLNKFPSRYFYNFGATYFISIVFRMN